MAKKMNMKKSEVMATLLSAYHFQEGRRVKWEVIHKAGKIIKKFEQDEKEAARASDKLRVDP